MDFRRHLLIDGYNVIHAWPELQVAFHGSGAIARERLAEMVKVIHDRERIRVTLVFDGKGDAIEIERPGGDTTFSLVFSPSSLSADDVIERLVGKSSEPELYTVVTRDNAERETIEALGAHGLSPDELRGWVDRASHLVGRDLEAHRRSLEQRWKEGRRSDLPWKGPLG